MSEMVNIVGVSMSVIEYHGQRVVTFAMIDAVHQRPKGTAKRNFSTNRKHFIEDSDYFELTRNEIRAEPLNNVFPPRTPKGMLFTQTGYLIVAKSFRTSQEITKQVCHSYFKDDSVLFLSVESPENSFGKFLYEALDGITSVRSQVKIQDYRVDFLLPEHGIVIEYDEEQHDRNAHTSKDCERDKALLLLGFTVIRVKKSQSYGKSINKILNALCYSNGFPKYSSL